MKLYHRTDFWGTHIFGRHSLAHLGLHHRIIEAQAILPELNAPHWGCCKESGKRVVEIKEHHFLEHDRGTWVLFEIRPPCETRKTGRSQNNYYDFCLMPVSSTLTPFPSWIPVGEVNPCMARMDLKYMLSHIMKRNRVDKRPTHHVHIFLVMDSLFQSDFKLVSGSSSSQREAAKRTSGTPTLCVTTNHSITPSARLLIKRDNEQVKSSNEGSDVKR
jgi:hypothetical protein